MISGMTVLEQNAFEAVIKIGETLEERNELLKKQNELLERKIALLERAIEEWEER